MMNFTIAPGLNLFSPTPIWVYEARENTYEKIQSELDVAYENSTFSERDDWGKTHFLSDTTFSKSVLHEQNCNALLEEIDYNLMIFLNSIGLEEKSYKFETSWFAKFKHNQYALEHTHCPADLSGIYYYKISEGHEGVKFKVANPLINTNIIANAAFGHDLTFNVKQGTMILFPSYIPHCVKTNQTNDDRVSVSFNLIFER